MRTAIAILTVCVGAQTWALAQAAPPQSLDELLQQVRQERTAERRHDKQREALFVKERDRQRQRLETARTEKAEAEMQADLLRAQYETNEENVETLENAIQERAGDMQELFALVRQIAVNTKSTLSESLISSQLPNRSASLDALGEKKRVPSIEDLEALWILLLEEMSQTGKVVQFDGPVITPSGEEMQRSVTRVGAFNAVSGGQFLRYLPETERLVELSRQPPLRLRAMAETLETAQSGIHNMPVDPSRGAILGLMVQSPTALERLHDGGGIGYVIIGLGALGLLVVLQRYTAVGLAHLKIRRQMRTQKSRGDNPLGRLMSIPQESPGIEPDILASRLEDRVAQEASHLQRGLSTVSILSAIAPLLGLLGTVTGMIATFQSITLFGTGDPKLMSGGISQALVTTQLGLAVAIPLLLLHGFLSGRVSRLVEALEHRSASLLAEHSGQPR